MAAKKSTCVACLKSKEVRHMKPFDDGYMCQMCKKRKNKASQREMLRASHRESVKKDNGRYRSTSKGKATTLKCNLLSEQNRKIRRQSDEKFKKKVLNRKKKLAKKHARHIKRQSQIRVYLSGCFSVEKDIIIRTLLKDERFKFVTRPSSDTYVVEG
jgi:PBP1b-binding outer membrane lipoprotein LpoB